MEAADVVYCARANAGKLTFGGAKEKETDAMNSVQSEISMCISYYIVVKDC